MYITFGCSVDGLSSGYNYFILLILYVLCNGLSNISDVSGIDRKSLLDVRSIRCNHLRICSRIEGLYDASRGNCGYSY